MVLPSGKGIGRDNPRKGRITRALLNMGGFQEGGRKDGVSGKELGCASDFQKLENQLHSKVSRRTAVLLTP